MSECCDGWGESRAGAGGLARGMAAVKKPTEAEEPEGAGKTQSEGMKSSPGAAAPWTSQEVTKGRESSGAQGAERWGGHMSIIAPPGATGSTRQQRGD